MIDYTIISGGVVRYLCFYLWITSGFLSSLVSSEGTNLSRVGTNLTVVSKVTKPFLLSTKCKIRVLSKVPRLFSLKRFLGLLGHLETPSPVDPLRVCSPADLPRRGWSRIRFRGSEVESLSKPLTRLSPCTTLPSNDSTTTLVNPWDLRFIFLWGCQFQHVHFIVINMLSTSHSRRNVKNGTSSSKEREGRVRRRPIWGFFIYSSSEDCSVRRRPDRRR